MKNKEKLKKKMKYLCNGQALKYNSINKRERIFYL
jgi:hypothetical protein